jgi:hypothetical protein
VAKQKLNHSPDGMNQIIKDHFRYEVQMLRYTHQRLCRGFAGTDKCEANAVIESFCIHARNLIDFLRETESKLSDGKYAAAVHFTDRYEAFKTHSMSDDLYGKLGEQIAHITYGRTNIDEEKLGAKERQRLFDLIAHEIPIFLGHLKEQYRLLWEEPYMPPPPASENAGDLVQATATSICETTVGTVILPAGRGRSSIDVTGATGMAAPPNKK